MKKTRSRGSSLGSPPLPALPPDRLEYVPRRPAEVLDQTLERFPGVEPACDDPSRYGRPDQSRSSERDFGIDHDRPRLVADISGVRERIEPHGLPTGASLDAFEMSLEHVLDSELPVLRDGDQFVELLEPDIQAVRQKIEVSQRVPDGRIVAGQVLDRASDLRQRDRVDPPERAQDV